MKCEGCALKTLLEWKTEENINWRQVRVTKIDCVHNQKSLSNREQSKKDNFKCHNGVTRKTTRTQGNLLSSERKLNAWLRNLVKNACLRNFENKISFLIIVIILRKQDEMQKYRVEENTFNLYIQLKES